MNYVVGSQRRKGLDIVDKRRKEEENSETEKGKLCWCCVAKERKGNISKEEVEREKINIML